MDALGTHMLIELKECNSELLDNVEYIEQAMVGAAKEAGATIVAQTFHKFSPRGVTGIVAIAESHLCIHTWPEYGYAAMDIFTCGQSFKPRQAIDLIVDRLHCTQPSITEIRRGPLAEVTASPV